MILSLKEIKKTEEQLIKLLKNETINIKASYLLSVISDKLVEEMDKIETFRENLVKKYGTQIEEQLVVTQENLKAFADEFEELLNVEVELDFQPVPLSFFGKEFTISAFDLSKLHKFIEIDKR